jgi:plastocyanin
VTSLIGATAKNTNGTDIALDASGGKHVVWAGTDGIWYAGGSPTFTASQVYSTKLPVTRAGSLGRPSVAIDHAGAPWVAFTVDTAAGQQVMVATLKGTTWKTQTVATIPHCSGCAQPGRTAIGVTAHGRLVVYVDGSTGAVTAAHRRGKTWTSEVVQGGISPSGLSMAVSKSGVPFIAYYTGDGAVNVATSSGSGWSISKVADAQPGNGTGNQAETTGVAVDDNGKLYVAWYDAAKSGVLLASGDGSTFAPVQTRGTQGGGFPSVGVAPDGSRVFLVWYDIASQDLLVGIRSDVNGLLVAEPSPSPLHTPPPVVTCSPTGSTKLALVASGTAFDVNCLAVSAGKPVVVTLKNQDPFLHDFSVYPSPSDVTQTHALFYGATKPATPSASTPYDIPPLKAGTYYFQCDFHPTSMFGTFIVK